MTFSVITLTSEFCTPSRVPSDLQQGDQTPQPLGAEVAQLAMVELGDLAVQAPEQFQAGWRDPAANEAPVVSLPRPADQGHLLETIEQTGGVGDPGYQTVAHLIAAEPLLPCPAKDPEGVVLRRRETVGLERVGRAVLQDRRGAGDGQDGLVFEAGERLPLPEFDLEVGRHEKIIDVITHTVNPCPPRAPACLPTGETGGGAGSQSSPRVLSRDGAARRQSLQIINPSLTLASRLVDGGLAPPHTVEIPLHSSSR